LKLRVLGQIDDDLVTGDSRFHLHVPSPLHYHLTFPLPNTSNRTTVTNPLRPWALRGSRSGNPIWSTLLRFGFVNVALASRDNARDVEREPADDRDGKLRLRSIETRSR